MRIPKELEIDGNDAIKHGVEWTKEYFKKAGKTCAVVGLSGGSDSTLTAYICVKALGKENVTGLIMPTNDSTPKEDVYDAEELARALGIKSIKIDIEPVISAVGDADPSIYSENNRITHANLKARIRMLLLYKEANKINALVAGTDDRSEHELGYFTKYGDGGVDINVPEYLYKTQVRALLEEIGKEMKENVFIRAAEKAPSPGLWKDQTAEGELNMRYEDIDRVFYYLNDYGKELDTKEIAELTSLSRETVDKITSMRRINAHKNALPPSPEIVKN